MSFLTPLFLALGLLAAPIIVLYMLRLRRREMLVSSTLLWQKLLRDREANAPWQRLRRNLLLLLQLLILAALVLALARPFLPVPSVVSGSIVVLLDGSASMLAMDVEPNRFEAAKNQVHSLIDELGGGDQMTLILVGRSPEVLVSATSDRSVLQSALDDAQAGPEMADWPSAVALASGAAQGFQEAKVLVVSDGGLPEGLPPLPAETVYIPIGSSGENLAVTALASRDTDSGPELFASVKNYGQVPREALISIDLDGTLAYSRRVSVPAGGSNNLTWNLPPGTNLITARLVENEGDILQIDDMAWSIHEGMVSNRVLILGEGNRFLETILGVLPGVEPFRAGPDTALNDINDNDYDMYILDGVPVPDPIPAADLLIIDPQPGRLDQATEADSLFGVTGVFSDTNVIRVSEKALLRFVDWSNVHIRQATTLDAPWADPLVVAEGGPLLLTGERNGRRIAILPFQLQESDLPLQIAFPILMANIIDWLNPGKVFGTSVDVRPGDPVAITLGADSNAVIVTKPNGEIWLETAGDAPIVFNETGNLGIYEVSLRDANGDQSAGSFAVNLFSPDESALLPAETIKLGQATIEQASDEDVGQREIWPWLAGLAFVVLLVEWWVFHRGTQILLLPDRQTIISWFGRH
jgi:hypothetical protein